MVIWYAIVESIYGKQVYIQCHKMENMQQVSGNCIFTQSLGKNNYLLTFFKAA